MDKEKEFKKRARVILEPYTKSIDTTKATNQMWLWFVENKKEIDLESLSNILRSCEMEG